MTMHRNKSGFQMADSRGAISPEAVCATIYKTRSACAKKLCSETKLKNGYIVQSGNINAQQAPGKHRV